MREVRFPDGFRLENLKRAHRRNAFHSGEAAVDDWLATKALQHQKKRLSVTKVLLDSADAVAAYYTLATGQVDFTDLPSEVTRHLPRRVLPVAVLAWLGVSTAHQGQGLGRRMLGAALRDCYLAGQTFAFVAVILDCINDAARSFYLQWDFRELPGHSHRLFLSAQQLDGLMKSP